MESISNRTIQENSSHTTVHTTTHSTNHMPILTHLSTNTIDCLLHK